MPQCDTGDHFIILVLQRRRSHDVCQPGAHGLRAAGGAAAQPSSAAVSSPAAAEAAAAEQEDSDDDEEAAAEAEAALAAKELPPQQSASKVGNLSVSLHAAGRLENLQRCL